MRATRFLLVTADDYGIGPETSRAIRELGSLGTVTSTVFLVNSPFAENEIDLCAAAASQLRWAGTPA